MDMLLCIINLDLRVSFSTVKRRHYCLSDILRITEELVYKGDWKYISIFSGDAFISRKKYPSAFSLLNVLGPEMVEVLTLFFLTMSLYFTGLNVLQDDYRCMKSITTLDIRTFCIIFFFCFIFFLENSARCSPKSQEF